LKALRNSLREFHKFFKGLAALTKTIGDKILIVMSNLYFFNWSRGMLVDFSATFDLVLVLDFEDVFSIRATAT
jgi:hypothetical protein